MNKRELGKTGIEVSEVAFGGAGIGMPYANQKKPPESETIELLRAAVEGGINFFDTARMYGKSEYLIGRAFRTIRSDVIISSKCNKFVNNSGKIPEYDVLDKLIRQSLEESLQALQTDYIDLYMLHQASIEVLQNTSVTDIFSNLKKEGKVRAIGASTYLPGETEQCIDMGIWDVVQVPFNLLDQKQRKYFKKAEDAGVGVVARSVLFRGMLSNKPVDFHPALKQVKTHIHKYEKLIKEGKMDLSTLAAKFVLSYDTISSVLIGIDKMEYLNKAIDMADSNYLNTDLLQKLEAMAYPDPDFLNFHEWYQKGWLKN